MRITHLTTAVIEANFDWTIIKIETDDGVTGYGEAFFGPGLTAVIREFARMLEGEDVESIDRAGRLMRMRSVHCSPGLALHAICGIEAALLDAIGKKHKLPIWQILGGKYRDAVEIYADCHAGESLESLGPLLEPRRPKWMKKTARSGAGPSSRYGWDEASSGHLTPQAYAARAREMAGRGFRILKFDVDVPAPYETDPFNRELSAGEIDYAASLVGAVRDAIGPDLGLAIDCHWAYTVRSAVELARALEKYRLLWFEDPIPPENLRALRAVQSATRATVATGENHYHRIDFERFIVEAGLRVLAPDVQKIGLWEGRKIADLADMHSVNLTLHNISGPIGTMAGVHLCAAIPNCLALEWHAAGVPFFDSLVKGADGPLIRNGKIAVPSAPGLGIEMDEDVAHKYRKPGEPFF